MYDLGYKKGFKDYEIDKLRRLYDWAKEPFDSALDRFAKVNFIEYFKEKDRRQGTNLRESFPEFKNFIDECENINCLLYTSPSPRDS